MRARGLGTHTALALVTALVLLCAVLWPQDGSPHEVVNTTVTFDREIIRILNKKCLACHSENNLGIPLTSYEQTRPWARAIEEEVLRRHMPPWRAVPGYGEFANDIGLTNREVQFLVAWVEGNGPRNKSEKMIVDISAPTPLKDRLTLDVTKWALGKPDLIKPLTVPSEAASAAGSVRRGVVDLGLTSDRWARAVAFQPADRRNVTAAFLSVQETGQGVGSWTPWHGATILPENTAFLLPAGSHLVVQVHSLNAAVDDRGSIGLYFAPAAVRVPKELTLTATPAAGGADGPQKFTGSATLDAPANLLAFNPEVQRGLQSIEISARRPDGAVEVLLLVRDPLPEWPTPYVFTRPMLLPEGTQLVLTGYIDASGGAEKPAALRAVVSLTAAGTPNVSSAAQ